MAAPENLFQIHFIRGGEVVKMHQRAPERREDVRAAVDEIRAEHAGEQWDDVRFVTPQSPDFLWAAPAEEKD